MRCADILFSENDYFEIKNQKRDSDILGLIAAIYKEAGKEEIYLKQHPEELEKLVEIAKMLYWLGTHSELFKK